MIADTEILSRSALKHGEALIAYLHQLGLPNYALTVETMLREIELDCVEFINPNYPPILVEFYTKMGKKS